MSVAEHQVLVDRYEILDELGRGGMAHVYRARDRVLGRIVALKVLPEWLASDPTYVERFRREARAAARLTHPGVVNVYDTGSDDGVHFIVMEFVDGRTLAERLAAQGALDPGEAARVGSQVADALSAAHAVGLVHRDVKPGNIMLTPAGDAKVMDFGIARAVGGGSITQTGTVFGTATYLSPEQAAGDTADERSDVYSLGVVLHETLTGSPPFTGPNAVAVARMHLEEDPEPPSRTSPRVPPDLDRVVGHAMEKDPGARYATAAELRDDLDRFRRGEAVLAGAPAGRTAVTKQVDLTSTSVLPPVGVAPEREDPDDGWVPPERRTLRRPDRRTLVAAAVLGVVLLVGAVVALAMSGSDPRTPAAARGGTAQGSSPAPETTSPPAQETTPADPTTAPADLLTAALTNLQDALAQGVVEGEVPEEVARHIADEVQTALDQVEKGDVTKAVERLDHLEESIWRLYDEGHILTEDRAAILADAVASLRDVIATDPSAVDEGPPGKSKDKDKGNGNAFGHDDDDDD